ncbi:group-specific protein [Paenibacillus sp. NPDC058177]|uniref:group-specific protein n=1 Tax=Paenibacillus sp. NPDC058177 TaxID=3346369 RepID=UPI0036DAC55C
MCKEKIDHALEGIDSDYVFWDSAELKRRTCMSWSTIQDTFFFDPRCPKIKIGGKWYFPTKKTREFLELWLLEHE